MAVDPLVACATIQSRRLLIDYLRNCATATSPLGYPARLWLAGRTKRHSVLTISAQDSVGTVGCAARRRMGNDMAPLLRMVLPGLFSKAAWELVEKAWRTVRRKPLEELYVESFLTAVEDARPRLARYTRDGEVSVDQAALRDSLRTTLGPSPGRVTPATVRDERFMTNLANALHERSAVIIGGHNLTRLEYVQVAYKLALKAARRFEDALTRDGEAFRRALLWEERENASTVQEILGILEQLNCRIDSLDTIAAELGKWRGAGGYPWTALGAQRVHSIQLELRDALSLMGGAGEASPAIIVPAWVPDQPPRRPAIYAPRTPRVGELLQSVHAATWLALVDGPGTGKTQLAREVAQMRDARVVCWVSLRGRTGAAAELHLEAQMVRWLGQLKGDDLLPDGAQILRHNLIHIARLVSECTGQDGLLIVDDHSRPSGKRASVRAFVLDRSRPWDQWCHTPYHISASAPAPHAGGHGPWVGGRRGGAVLGK